MGNQASSDTEITTVVSPVVSSAQRLKIRDVSQPKRAPKSKIRLVPLSGSPSTSTTSNNEHNPLSAMSHNTATVSKKFFFCYTNLPNVVTCFVRNQYTVYR